MKPKKIAIFVLLFAAAGTGFFLLFPSITQAAASNPAALWAWPVKNAGARGVTWLIAYLANIGVFFIASGAALVQWLCFHCIQTILPVLLMKFFSANFYAKDLGGFATNQHIVTAWRTTVSICNFLFIIALLFIGVGTIFRLEKYNYKKLLIKLVVAALLTNFSLVFAGIILDFLHVIMFSIPNPFEGVGKAATNSTDVFIKPLYDVIGTSIGEAGELMKRITMGRDQPLIIMPFASRILFSAILLSAAILVLFAAAIFLLIRTVMLWVLLILSPFAYISLVFPDTAQIAKKWWSAFLKAAIAGPIFVFFMYTASQITGKVAPMNTTDIEEDDVLKLEGQTDEAKKYLMVSDDGMLWLRVILVISLIGSSIVTATLLGGAGANTIIGTIKLARGSRSSASDTLSARLLAAVRPAATESPRPSPAAGASRRPSTVLVTPKISPKPGGITPGQPTAPVGDARPNIPGVGLKSTEGISQPLETAADMTLARAAYQRYLDSQDQSAAGIENVFNAVGSNLSGQLQAGFAQDNQNEEQQKMFQEEAKSYANNPAQLANELQQTTDPNKAAALLKTAYTTGLQKEVANELGFKAGNMADLIDKKISDPRQNQLLKGNLAKIAQETGNPEWGQLTPEGRANKMVLELKGEKRAASAPKTMPGSSPGSSGSAAKSGSIPAPLNRKSVSLDNKKSKTSSLN